MPYFSAGCFPLVCIHCGGKDDILHGAGVDHMPTCRSCLPDKPQINKRKRNVVGSKAKKPKRAAAQVHDEDAEASADAMRELEAAMNSDSDS